MDQWILLIFVTEELVYRYRPFRDCPGECMAKMLSMTKALSQVYCCPILIFNPDCHLLCSLALYQMTVTPKC